MLTADDEKLIARAIVDALNHWSLVCALVGVIVWLGWFIITR